MGEAEHRPASGVAEEGTPWGVSPMLLAGLVGRPAGRWTRSEASAAKAT